MKISTKTIALMSLLLGSPYATGSGSDPASTAASQTLTFGVVPQQSATKLARLWGPVFLHIKERTGYNLRFKTAPNIDKFEKRLRAGKYDFAYMNPYHYTLLHNNPGYTAFAKQKNKKLQGIIVVKKNSRYKNINQLEGQTLAFPSPAAFAASVLPRASLRSLGIKHKSKYVSSHDSVYRTVTVGLYPAGGGIMRTLNSMDKSVRDQLRILWTSKAYTPHAFTAHPRIDKNIVKKIKTVMLDMQNDKKGQQLLAALHFTGIETATDKDWNDVRALNISQPVARDKAKQ